MESKEIIWDRRASKYVIPFSRDKVDVWDAVIEGKRRWTIIGVDKKQKQLWFRIRDYWFWPFPCQHIKTISYGRFGSLAVIADFHFTAYTLLDKTPSLITRLYDRFMDWLESYPSD